ncbi:MAG: hypothetical protein ACRDGV_12650 [Candidatus Limnocylindria bacterium]
MEELARRYLGLVVRMARHRPDLLEAFAGPDELSEAVAGEALTPLSELHDEALRIEADANEAPAISDPERRRARWLALQAAALAASARVLQGEEIGLPDLVESLCDLAAERTPEPELIAAHRLLDAALPPGASLRARLAAHRGAMAVPPEHVPAAVEALAELLRERAASDLGLPDDESLAFEPVHAAGEAWHVRAHPERPLRTRLELNLSTPWSVDEIVRAAGGEAYPGGHAARTIREATSGRTHPELLAWIRPAPEASIRAGIGAVGREVILGDFELAAELRRIGRQLGLRWEPERALEVGRARGRLAAAVANATLLLHHDGLPASEVQAYLAEIALLEPDAADRVMSLLADPLRSVEPFARAHAPGLVREWLSLTGQTDGLRRLMVEPLTPGQLRAEAGVTA